MVQALQTLDFGRSERLVRMNPMGSALAEHDLRSTITGRPDGYVLPKAEFAEQVEAVAEFLVSGGAGQGLAGRPDRDPAHRRDRIGRDERARDCPGRPAGRRAALRRRTGRRHGRRAHTGRVGGLLRQRRGYGG